ncbi:NAD-P-binding protein [Umbelopsis sp. AD052]|nr:NAD-P-binding protein [Umbelopsis sp. AD052]
MPNKNFGFHTEADEVATYFENEIKGKTILITGCTWNDLNAECARIIAKHHAALVIVAGEKHEQLDEAIQKIHEETPSADIRPLVINFASLYSVRHAAAQVNAYVEDIDVLINNSDIKGCPYHTTEDGFEAIFGTNYVGPFLFINLIMPKILASTAPRIVSVSGIGHLLSAIRFDDLFFDNGNSYTEWIAYAQSRTANILFGCELSKRFKNRGLAAFSLHPGVIKKSSCVVNIKILQGTSTLLVAAFDPTIASESGSYLVDCQIAMNQVNPWATDDTQAEKLWKLSEKLVGQTFD